MLILSAKRLQQLCVGSDYYFILQMRKLGSERLINLYKIMLLLRGKSKVCLFQKSVHFLIP